MQAADFFKDLFHANGALRYPKDVGWMSWRRFLGSARSLRALRLRVSGLKEDVGVVSQLLDVRVCGTTEDHFLVLETGDWVNPFDVYTEEEVPKLFTRRTQLTHARGLEAGAEVVEVLCNGGLRYGIVNDRDERGRLMVDFYVDAENPSGSRISSGWISDAHTFFPLHRGTPEAGHLVIDRYAQRLDLAVRRCMWGARGGAVGTQPLQPPFDQKRLLVSNCVTIKRAYAAAIKEELTSGLEWPI